MSDKFRFPNRNQPYLLPISIEDWVQEDHLARFVVEVTEELDIRAIRDKYRGNGIQAYDWIFHSVRATCFHFESHLFPKIAPAFSS